MQTRAVGGTGGILATGLSIVQKESFLAMYKGIIPPLISLSILNTATFTAYSFFQSALNAQRGWDIRNGFAGACCGMGAGTVSTVENLIKTQMQIDNVGKKQFQGSWHCVRQLTSMHGGSVVYTGHAVNTLRELSFLSIYFFAYEGFREQLMGATGTSGDRKWAIPVAGGLAGAIAWGISFPLDCVRAGVQGQDLSTPERKGAMRVFGDLMREKGVRGLYAGVAPSLTRAFLVSGSRFSAYEGALWLLRGGRDLQ